MFYQATYEDINFVLPRQNYLPLSLCFWIIWILNWVSALSDLAEVYFYFSDFQHILNIG